MFGKKPAPPPPAPPKPQAAPPPAQPARAAGWPMLALTADYGVMGYLTPVEMPLTGFMNTPTQATFTLAHAQMQALGVYGMTRDSTPEAILPKAGVIALVPRDEAGQRSAAQQMPGQGHRAVLYAGPFMIKAAVRVAGDTPLRNALSTMPNAFFALTDAAIHCQLPGSKFPDLTTPILILNKNLTQFYHPE